MSEINEQLLVAVREDSVAAASAMINEGADVNATVWNQAGGLIDFIESTDMFNVLVGAGIKIDHKTLLRAAGTRRTRLVQCLLDYGLPIDGSEHAPGKLHTILMMSAGHGNIDMVRFLIENGANVGICGRRSRWTALHFAVNNAAIKCANAHQRPYLEIIDLLLQHGADIEARDDEGMTPLIRAAHNLASDLTEHLLMAGAYIHAIDLGNRTAIDHATRSELRRKEEDMKSQNAGVDLGDAFRYAGEATLIVLQDWAADHPISIDRDTGEILR